MLGAKNVETILDAAGLRPAPRPVARPFLAAVSAVVPRFFESGAEGKIRYLSGVALKRAPQAPNASLTVRVFF